MAAYLSCVLVMNFLMRSYLAYSSHSVNAMSSQVVLYTRQHLNTPVVSLRIQRLNFS